MQEKKRKLLFATDHSNVPVPEWTPLFKTSHVNWKQFFKKESTKLEIIKQMGEAILNKGEDDEEEEDLEHPEHKTPKKTKEQILEESLMANLKSNSYSSDMGDDMSVPSLSSSASFLSLEPNKITEKGIDLRGSQGMITANLPGSSHGSRASFSNSSAYQQIPKTLLESLPKDVRHDIIPLPFGNIVKKQKVYEGKLKFYQVEVFNPKSLLTIEIEMLRGSCDLLVNFDKLPSTVKYQQKLTCVTKKRKKKIDLSPERLDTGNTALTNPAIPSAVPSTIPSVPSTAQSTHGTNSPFVGLKGLPNDATPKGSANPNFFSPTPGKGGSSSPLLRSATFTPNVTRPSTANSEFPTDQQGGKILNETNLSKIIEEEEKLPEPNPRNDRIFRLIVEPEGIGKYFIAIHATSKPGTSYNLWAYLSGEREQDDQYLETESEANKKNTDKNDLLAHQRLQKVDDIIRKWNLLVDEHTEEELSLYFTKLEMEAGNQIHQENERKKKNFVKRREILEEIKELKTTDKYHAVLLTVDDKLKTLKENIHNPDVLIETENLEKFITKVGRYAIKKERELILKKTKEIIKEQQKTSPNKKTSPSPKKKETPTKNNSDKKNIKEDDDENQRGENDEGIDFDNLFDANDIFLQNNNLLIHDLREEKQLKKQLTRNNTQNHQTHHPFVSSSGVAIGHAHIPERIQAPPSFQHPELFSVPDVHRNEKLLMLKPLTKNTDEINFRKEYELLQKEENFIKGTLARQSSSLPVLSLHFNTVKYNNQTVHSSSPTSKNAHGKFPFRRMNSSFSDKELKDTEDSEAIGASNSSVPKLPQIVLPKYIAASYDSATNPSTTSNTGRGGSSSRRSISPVNNSSRQAANRQNFIQHYHYLEGNEDEENSLASSLASQDRKGRFPMASQWTSLPNSLEFDPSASSPVVNLALDSRLQKEKKKIQDKKKQKELIHSKSLTQTPKIINYTLTRLNN